MPRRYWMASTKTTAFGFSLILTLGFGSPASAQRLDLDDGPEPPVLTRSVLDDIAERFADDGGDRRNEAGSLNVIAEARRNLRRIAVELAHRGGGAGDAAMVAGLQAIRLVANISEFDAMLDALARPGTFVGSPPRPISQESRDAAIERLRDFNRSGLDHLRRSDTGTLPRLDATLSHLTHLGPTDHHSMAERRLDSIELREIGSGVGAPARSSRRVGSGLGDGEVGRGRFGNGCTAPQTAASILGAGDRVDRNRYKPPRPTGGDSQCDPSPPDR
jgi:hypothetical protein